MVSEKAQLKIQVLKNFNKFLVPEFSKKAQLKIQEMSFMLVAIMIFFLIVGLFGVSVFYSNLKQSANEIKEQGAIFLVNSLAESPEFNYKGKSNCVDEDKLIGLMNSKSYSEFWDFTSIVVLRSSGFDKESFIECGYEDSLENYENCDSFVVYDKGVENEQKISSFVALCHTEYENYYAYDKCELGRLVVGVELE